MHRRPDDQPNLNSSGIFLSNSLSTTNHIRPFSELNTHRSGIVVQQNNIPPATTNNSATTTASLSPFHHSSGGRTVSTPVSPRAGVATNSGSAVSSGAKPPNSRQPLALIQETVHAVGSGGSLEMQSGVQFSIPSGYQPRVAAAATTLSQGSLGQSSHHSLPIQAQAHSNTQIVHPIQQTNSQAHVAAQMQGHQMQFQRLKVEDALSYLDQVKYKFGNQPQVYNDFLDIMKEFKSQSIDTPGVIQRVSNLFRGHPELIVGFNTFLPPGYRIEVQPNEQVQVSIPGTSMGAGGVPTGPTSLTIHPTGPPSTVHHPVQPSTHNTQTNHNTNSPHTSPSNAVSNKSSSHPTPVVNNNQSHSTNSQNQHHFNQSSPAHSQPPTTSPNHSPNNAPQQQNQQQQSSQQPVEFNHAINYVNKIKNRFQGQPDIYKQFLEILHTYQKEQRNIKDQGQLTAKPLTEGEVYSQVATLFKHQEDLLQEFGQFLPDANGSGNAFAGLTPAKSVNNEHNAVIKKPSLPVKPIPPLNNQPKAVQVVKRPAPQLPSPPIKKPRMTSLKDVTVSEAGKCGTLNEFAFFDKVRKALKSQDVYDNFLRCLIIYNQELISRSDLVLVVTPFLSKYPDLFKWFKDFLGYKESNNIEIVPKKLEEEERERVVGDFATEIDYSSCIKYGASYRAVPRNYVQPKCSGRTPLCKEVLNDTWVSFPSWSEDSTFVSSRKTQFEEYIYRCEDERFELDVVLETNLSTIRILESEMTKMNRMSADEKARYRLDDSLGGSSYVIQQRAIRRIYGDKSPDIIEGLKKNPANAVPLVLRRLKAKDEEWRKSQKLFNKIWREQNEKYYLKSLDHQGINFKQNDVKYLRSKSILNEIETIYEERHEQADESMMDLPSGPHLVLTYINRDIFKDAANLIIHHVKRQTGIHKEDKTKIKQLMRQFFPDFFSVPRGDLSDDEADKDEDMDIEDGNDSPRPNNFKNLWSLSIACKNSAPLPREEKISTPMDTSLSDESYNLMFVNNNWYIFFRLHHILCERLLKLHERAQAMIAEEMRDQEERKQSTALALRLKERHILDVDACFSNFLEMVKNLLDNNLESNQYEDNLREMFGIQAYLGFTLDKVIQNVVRQLQHIVGDESCTQWTTLFLEESKNRATGGLCSTSSQRAAAELAYQRRAEGMCDDNLYKMIMYKEDCKLTIELLDTDSDSPEEGNKWITFVRKFCEESMLSSVKDHIKRNPPFLFRVITAYMSRKKLQKEKECGDREQENALRSIQEEIDDSKIDLSRLEDGGAGEAVKGLVGLNAKAKFLERTRLSKLNESSESGQGSVCRFNVNSFKMLWVVDCEDNNICKPCCLLKARKSHKRVSERLNQRFRSWHRTWLKKNVDDEQEKKCKNWLLGQTEDNVPTHCIRVDNPNKPPYSIYNRYKPQQKDKT